MYPREIPTHIHRDMCKKVHSNAVRNSGRQLKREKGEGEK
jgi:hypothetical protein